MTVNFHLTAYTSFKSLFASNIRLATLKALLAYGEYKSSIFFSYTVKIYSKNSTQKIYIYREKKVNEKV
jgi:hypothetical protein